MNNPKYDGVIGLAIFAVLGLIICTTVASCERRGTCHSKVTSIGPCAADGECRTILANGHSKLVYLPVVGMEVTDHCEDVQ